MRDEAWNTFTQTGKVSDYLAYRYKSEEEDAADKQVRGESVYGADHCTYGNGITDNAH